MSELWSVGSRTAYAGKSIKKNLLIYYYRSAYRGKSNNFKFGSIVEISAQAFYLIGY